MPTVSAADHDLDLELAYTPVDAACRVPYGPNIYTWCRRAARHDDDHAAGHGEHRRRWPR